MQRSAFVIPVLLFVGCAPALIRTSGVWQIEDAPYALTALPSGRLMPDGWQLAHFRRASPDRLERVGEAPVPFLFLRRDDDGVLTLRHVRQPQRKSLRTYVDRFVAEVRPVEQEVIVNNLLGLPVAQGATMVDHPVKVLSAEVFGSGVADALEGYEAVIEQRRPGEEQPYRLFYVAFVRPAKERDVVEITYANTPSAFTAGLEDVRVFARRVRFGELEFPPLSMDPVAPTPGTLHL